MLFKRDYFVLTDKENQQLKKAEAFYSASVKRSGSMAVLDGSDLTKYHELLPNAFLNHNSLFPNNRIIFNHDKHAGELVTLFQNFETLVKEKKTIESDLLKFIKHKESYFILESLLPGYSTGNHDAYLFREFSLPPDYRVDFLLVGKNSDGFQFIFIEFESPNKEITIKDGTLGNSFRKGLRQVEDWETWLDSNFSTLKQVFKKYKNPQSDLPLEFYEYDKTRMHFLVVAGRRKHFNETTYRLKRKGLNGIKLIHYDNLLDAASTYVQIHHSQKKHNSR